ncbi:MAG TPA: hypothetical protein VMI06_18080 [Terriglobia bacterium]|nr:hypothetical protein [Terriglobia bacterium]
MTYQSKWTLLGNRDHDESWVDPPRFDAVMRTGLTGWQVRLANRRNGLSFRFRLYVCAVAVWTSLPCSLLALRVESNPSTPPPATASSPHLSLTVPLTLPKGTALDIALTRRVPILRAGEPIEGRLVLPVYAFDRVVAPAGSIILGRVTAIKSAPRKERAQAIMQGNFSPLRSAQLEFDTLVLRDGRRIPVQTRVSPAISQVVRLEVAGGSQQKRPNRVSQTVANAKRQMEREKNQVLADIRSPGRARRVKNWLIDQLPYHRQFLPAGVHFTAALSAPVVLGSARIPDSELNRVGSAPPSNSVLQAMLLTPLSSATAQRGTPAKAIVTRPVFAKGHELIIPQGSVLEGRVVQAEPARRLRLHRNGILRFTFLKIQTPHGMQRPVVGTLQGVEVSKKEKLKLDSEGGVHSTTSKMDYVAPAIAVLIAAVSAAPDVDVRPDGRIYTDTNGPAGGQVIGGGLGYKLIGIATALAVRYQPVTAGFAAYGAALSVYSHLLSRGQNVVLPKDTPIEIRLGERPSTTPGRTAQSVSNNNRS